MTRPLLLIGPAALFAKSVVSNGWASTVEAALGCLLLAFLVYFDPKRTELDEKFVGVEAKFDEFKQSIARLESQIKDTRFKIGIRPER